MANTFTITIGYRVGGPDHFTWQRTTAYTTYAEALDAQDVLRQGGYLSYIYKTDQLDSIGLPDTFEPSDNVPFFAMSRPPR